MCLENIFIFCFYQKGIGMEMQIKMAFAGSQVLCYSLKKTHLGTIKHCLNTNSTKKFVKKDF